MVFPLHPVIQLMFTTGDITVTDDVGTADVCVGVDAELSDDQVSYRVPIVVETIGITAGKLVPLYTATSLPKRGRYFD